LARRRGDRSRIEARDRIVMLVDEVEREGKDPFSVSVGELLADLREDYDSDDVELLLADSRAIEALSRLVEMQDEWVEGRLLATISPEVLRRRAEALDARELAGALYSAQFPAVGVSNVNEVYLVRAAEYWEGLRPRRPPEPPARRERPVTAPLEPDNFEEDLSSFRSRLMGALEGGGEVSLDEVLSGGREARVREAYLLAHLVTRGEVGLRYDPERDRYLVTARPEGEVRSVVIEV